MLRTLLAVTAGGLALGVMLAVSVPGGEPSRADSGGERPLVPGTVAAAFYALERDMVRVTAEGARLANLGDDCSAALEARDRAAPDLCRRFLEDAARWTAPLDALGRRIADLEADAGDGTLVAIGAGRPQALEAVTSLAAVTARLGAQASRVAANLAPPDRLAPDLLAQDALPTRGRLRVH